ncbi:hypothetical protein ACLHDG_09925 [Sulfurovum sp. CS9]|uniref:hypothetical protein n=1 Tax=Sulfurovum sp. CS9 TaxID=3391146 RepID=UPI0039E9F57F
MNDSTKDSQELIKDLGKAGDGLSSGRAFFLRYLGFPLLNSIISWERALDIFEKEGEKVLFLARSMKKDKLFERVLVPKLFGLEDNSRYYSVAMVIEHLIIVGSALKKRIPLLSQGKNLDKEIKIEDYKPYMEIDETIIDQYEIFLHSFRKEVEENVDNIYLENRHEHPWFGELKAKDWSVMGAIHQMVHRRQIEAIIRGL